MGCDGVCVFTYRDAVLWVKVWAFGRGFNCNELLSDDHTLVVDTGLPRGVPYGARLHAHRTFR